MSICRSGLSPVVGYDSSSTLPAERLTKLIRMQACAYGMCVGGWRAVQVVQVARCGAACGAHPWSQQASLGVDATGRRRGHRQLVDAACMAACVLCWRNGARPCARHVAEARLAVVALCRRVWPPPSAPPMVARPVARPVADDLRACGGRRAVRSGWGTDRQTWSATGASWARVCHSRRAAGCAEAAARANLLDPQAGLLPACSSRLYLRVYVFCTQ